eukprot:TRINITY_DN5782_c0_g1_i2.p1 TRINITY_DN5782_c0_g1~~TRINITY_DN5782_c0_g1_i2.p1  ORF type:complete len:563 (+),score=181.79 TRINITY_DN5782_c0_g1_i2:136-1689(+)
MNELVTHHEGRTRNRNFFGLGLLGGVGAAFGVIWVIDRILNPPSTLQKDRPKVVVVGAGWAGLSAVGQIDPNLYDVTLVSPRNYFLFTPLLTNVTFGAIDPNAVAEPIRSFLSRYGREDTTYLEAYCTDVDPIKKKVTCQGVGQTKSFEVEYDKLILAVGGSVNTFGINGVFEHCNLLRDIKDARDIRRRLIDCFEYANLPGVSEDEKVKKLSFVIVGGGPTSLELYSELHDLFHDLQKTYPELSSLVKLTLIDTREHNLNTYDAKISTHFRQGVFRKKCKEMKENSGIRISRVSRDSLTLVNGVTVPFGMCIWVTGNTPHPLVSKLMSKRPDKQYNKKALITNDFLAVKGFQDIYALGDCATIDQARLLRRWGQIFEDMDENEDGSIDRDEFIKGVKMYARRFPQLLEFAKHAERLFEEGDVNHDEKLSREEFQEVLKKVDSTITSLPTTAQCAQQQGRYIGVSLNNTLREADLRKLFHELDVNHNGSLDKIEVKKGLQKLKLPANRVSFQVESSS